MRLIGLNGRLHSGKDTTFEAIDRYALSQNLIALRRAFADPLKVSGMRSLGFDNTHEELVALANELKETGRITVTWQAGTKLLSKSITGRTLWQLYGTEAHRADDLGSSFSEDFWVDNLLPYDESAGRIDTVEGTTAKPRFWHNFKEELYGYADFAVVTDVRFANEATRIIDLGGEVWHIDADERLGPNKDEHASEQPLPPEFITTTIDNNGSLEAFHRNVFEVLLDDDD